MNRKRVKNYSAKAARSLGISGLLLMAMAFVLPGQVFAETCPFSADLGFVAGNGPFELNEEIPIKLTLRMRDEDPSTVVSVTHLNYLMDCIADDDITGVCTPQGNGVEFIGPVSTDCSLSELAFDQAYVATSRTGDTVDLYVRDDNVGTPSSNAAIRIASTATPGGNTCELEFKVKIDSLSDPQSTEPIVELSIFAGDDAECDNGRKKAESDSLNIPIVNPNAVFWVTKDFIDDNEDPVDVHIRCDTGIRTVTDFQITDPAVGGTFPMVGFIVYGIPSTGANCWVYEDPVPTGYAESYEAGLGIYDVIYSDYYDINEDDESDERLGCYFKGVKGGQFTCDITDTPLPVEVEVTKVWDVTGTGGDYFSRDAKITIGCTGEITDYTWKKGDYWYYRKGLEDGDYVDGQYTITVGVIPEYPSSSCFADEDNDSSAVEVTSDCGSWKNPAMEVSAGHGDSCTITNTLYFEGIPTLNQYGMALMALLMLGLGVLGLRRFA